MIRFKIVSLNLCAETEEITLSSSHSRPVYFEHVQSEQRRQALTLHVHTDLKQGLQRVQNWGHILLLIGSQATRLFMGTLLKMLVN
jgi:hypothetical protein